MLSDTPDTHDVEDALDDESLQQAWLHIIDTHCKGCPGHKLHEIPDFYWCADNRCFEGAAYHVIRSALTAANKRAERPCADCKLTDAAWKLIDEQMPDSEEGDYTTSEKRHMAALEEAADHTKTFGTPYLDDRLKDEREAREKVERALDEERRVSWRFAVRYLNEKLGAAETGEVAKAVEQMRANAEAEGSDK